MNRIKRVLFIGLAVLFVVSSCSAQPTSAPAQVIEPVFTPSDNLPLIERDVPRVSVEEARTALESGTAIIVDVRNPPAFGSRHIAGAINIPLVEIERNPMDLPLRDDQWVITYCT